MCFCSVLSVLFRVFSLGEAPAAPGLARTGLTGGGSESAQNSAVRFQGLLRGSAGELRRHFLGMPGFLVGPAAPAVGGPLEAPAALGAPFSCCGSAARPYADPRTLLAAAPRPARADPGSPRASPGAQTPWRAATAGYESCVGLRKFPLGLHLSLWLFVTLGGRIVSGSGREEAEEQRGS